MRNVAVTLRGLGVRTYLFRSLQSDTANLTLAGYGGVRSVCRSL